MIAPGSVPVCAPATGEVWSSDPATPESRARPKSIRTARIESPWPHNMMFALLRSR